MLHRFSFLMPPLSLLLLAPLASQLSHSRRRFVWTGFCCKLLWRNPGVDWLCCGLRFDCVCLNAFFVVTVRVLTHLSSPVPDVFAGNLAGLAFAFFTFANTAPRGVSHHKWYECCARSNRSSSSTVARSRRYREKFGSTYPANRKAVIPFLW